MSLSVLDVAGVVLQNFLSQVAAVQMHIDLCGANVFVAEHGLYGAEVGAPLQQMGGKAVAEGVGADVFGDAGPLCVFLYEDKEADAAQMAASGGGDEDVVLFPRNDLQPLAHGKPGAEFAYGLSANGNEALFPPLSVHPYIAVFQKKVADFQRAEFGYPQPAAVEGLNDGPVPLPFGSACVNGANDVFNLFQAEHLGQMLAYLWAFEQCCGVVGDFLFQLQEAVEGAHATQRAGCAAGRCAFFPHLAGKLVQLFQGYRAEVYAFVGIIVEQFLQILAIGIQRVAAISAFQTQVSDVALNDVFVYNSTIVYLVFHIFFLTLYRQRYEFIMRIQIINGPNLNLLGVREPAIYGKRAWEDYLKDLRQRYPNVRIDYYQSNLEGDIINKIQEVGFDRDGIVLNAGAYTHTSVAILDAIKSVNTPTIEVHISNVHQREEFRHHSMISRGCMGVICGFGLDSYRLAIEAILTKSETEE